MSLTGKQTEFICPIGMAGPSVFGPLKLSTCAAQEPATDDIQPLLGRWMRPDGGYILELGRNETDNGIKAAYYNPRPINVARAELQPSETGNVVFIELRDINYPGSTYTLRYDPTNDRLHGIYYQAVYRQSFTVEFVRLK